MTRLPTSAKSPHRPTPDDDDEWEFHTRQPKIAQPRKDPTHTSDSRKPIVYGKGEAKYVGSNARRLISMQPQKPQSPSPPGSTTESSSDWELGNKAPRNAKQKRSESRVGWPETRVEAKRAKLNKIASLPDLDQGSMPQIPDDIYNDPEFVPYGVQHNGAAYMFEQDEIDKAIALSLEMKDEPVYQLPEPDHVPTLPDAPSLAPLGIKMSCDRLPMSPYPAKILTIRFPLNVAGRGLEYSVSKEKKSILFVWNKGVESLQGEDVQINEFADGRGQEEFYASSVGLEGMGKVMIPDGYQLMPTTKVAKECDRGSGFAKRKYLVGFTREKWDNDDQSHLVVRIGLSLEYKLFEELIRVRNMVRASRGINMDGAPPDQQYHSAPSMAIEPPPVTYNKINENRTQSGFWGQRTAVEPRKYVSITPLKPGGQSRVRKPPIPVEELESRPHLSKTPLYDRQIPASPVKDSFGQLVALHTEDDNLPPIFSDFDNPHDVESTEHIPVVRAAKIPVVELSEHPEFDCEAHEFFTQQTVALPARIKYVNEAAEETRGRPLHALRPKVAEPLPLNGYGILHHGISSQSPSNIDPSLCTSTSDFLISNSVHPTQFNRWDNSSPTPSAAARKTKRLVKMEVLRDSSIQQPITRVLAPKPSNEGLNGTAAGSFHAKPPSIEPRIVRPLPSPPPQKRKSPEGRPMPQKDSKLPAKKGRLNTANATTTTRTLTQRSIKNAWGLKTSGLTEVKPKDGADVFDFLEDTD